jgi:3-hydroxyacyl-[acyl-carrier-protein] dehydratase
MSSAVPQTHAGSPPSPTGFAADAPRSRIEDVRACKGLIFDLSDVDLTARVLSRAGLEELNPHRHEMALIDWIIWHSPDFTRGVALKHTRDDEFWVKGHFPGKPMFPGVLMIESAAQLAVYLYNARLPAPRVAAFTRIEQAVFRAPVMPGHDLYLLCKEIKWSSRGFTCDVQGVVGDKIAFEARVQGVAI